jgi:hypothetical protein
LLVFIIFSVLFLICYTHGLYHVAIAESDKEDNLALSVTTDELKYVDGQLIKIMGSVGYDNNNSIANSTGQKPEVSIEVFHEDNNPVPVYKTSLLVLADNFTHEGLKLKDRGIYTVKATVSADGSSENAFTFFEVNDWLISRPAFFMIGALISFSVLMFLILVDMKKSIHSLEVYRFLCLSAIAIFPILALVTADVAIGSGSTIGLIVEPPSNSTRQPLVNENGEAMPGGEWMLNIGGHQDNHFADGIQVPINVVVFGLAGGYIRYLYYTIFERRTGGDVRERKDDTLEGIERKKLELLEQEYPGVGEAIRKFRSDHPDVTAAEEFAYVFDYLEKEKNSKIKSREDLTDDLDSKLLNKLKTEHLGLEPLIEKYRIYEEKVKQENELEAVKNEQKHNRELDDLKNKRKRRTIFEWFINLFKKKNDNTEGEEEDSTRREPGNSQKNNDEKSKKNLTKEDLRRAIHVLIIRNRRKFVLNQTLKDIKLFILAPLLAVAVWFLLLQADVENLYIISVVSFTVGLVTEQVISTLTHFTQFILTKDRTEIESKRKEAIVPRPSSYSTQNKTEIDA